MGPACGPAGATESFIFERPLLSTTPPGVHPCRYCCIYQAIESTYPGHPVADKFPQLYMCTIPNISGGGPIGCSPNTEIRQLTAGPPRNLDTGETQVAVEAATFTLVTSICSISPYEPCNQASSPSGCTTETGSSCVPTSAPRVEIQFLICQPDPQASTTTPCTDTQRPPVFSPLRFGLSATARN